MADDDLEIILVNESDEAVGFEKKMAVHRGSGQLHRAFSVLIFNTDGDMLLQLRSIKKYHFGGLWSNACCGHPTRGQATLTAAADRLNVEFGFRVELCEAFSFIYEAHDVGSGLTEKEFDHVLLGVFDGEPAPNPNEIDECRWITPTDLLADMRRAPERYTPWFRIILERYSEIQVRSDD